MLALLLNKQPRTDVCRGNAGRGVQQYVESVEAVEDIRGSVEFVFFITGNVTFAVTACRTWSAVELVAEGRRDLHASRTNG